MKAEFYYNKRKYVCGIFKTESSKELRIRNERGEVLAIEQGKRIGFQGKKRENSKEVDVSQPYLYNLIKAAVNALELTEKNQLLIEKDQIINEKDEQIELLNQQLSLFNQERALSINKENQLGQLQDATQERVVAIEVLNQRIAQLENELRQPETALVSEKNIETKIRTKLGEPVWGSLHPSSQKDLCSAYKNYLLIKSEVFTAQVADYSEAGRRLGIVAEREIVAPFFTALYQFVSVNRNSLHLPELGGIILKSKGKHTLGDLPALLSSQWETFIENVLEQEECLPEDKLYRTVFKGVQVSQTDRQIIKQFFQQWQHPSSRWLAGGEAAASAIDKIRKLRNRASHTDVLYLWQFKELWSLIVGRKTTRGVLQKIY